MSEVKESQARPQQSYEGDGDELLSREFPIHCCLPEMTYIEEREIKLEMCLPYGRGRSKLRHADRWFTYDTQAPYRMVGFDNRGRKMGP